jgi:hypothetical protein
VRSLEAMILRGWYRNYKTKFYVGLRNGKFTFSTRKENLDFVLKTYLIGRREFKTVAYCSKHAHIVTASGFSDFHLRAAERAQDCGEFHFLEECWDMSRNLGEALLTGDPEVLKKLPKTLRRREVLEKLTKSPKLGEILARLKSMNSEAVPPKVEEA